MTTKQSKTPAPRVKKAVHKTDAPFTIPRWPTVDSNDVHVMIQMLCRILQPIGHHRRTYPPPSKVTRRANRKRSISKQPPPPPSEVHDEANVPPPPTISQSITVGLNGTAQHLESLVSQPNNSLQPAPSLSRKPDYKANPQIAAIFLPSISATGPLPLQFQHLPTLAYLASRSAAHQSSPPTEVSSLLQQALIIPISLSHEGELAKALGIPRVSALGVMADAPGTESLLQFCREKVAKVNAGWIEEVVEGRLGHWKGANISTEGG